MGRKRDVGRWPLVIERSIPPRSREKDGHRLEDHGYSTKADRK